MSLRVMPRSVSEDVDGAAPASRLRLRVAGGLDTARRGGGLAAGSGLLLLCLDALGRAGLGARGVPELRALLGYDSLVLHGGLWLGFVLHAGGFAWAATGVAARSDRVALFGLSGLSALALVTVGLVAQPGRVPAPGGPPPGAGTLGAAALAAVALAGGLLATVLAIPAGAGPDTRREVLPLGALLMLATLAVSEAAGQLIPLEPVSRLGTTAIAAALAAAAVLWLSGVQRSAIEALRAPDGPPHSAPEAETTSSRRGAPRARSDHARASQSA